MNNKIMVMTIFFLLLVPTIGVTALGEYSERIDQKQEWKNLASGISNVKGRAQNFKPPNDTLTKAPVIIAENLENINYGEYNLMIDNSKSVFIDLNLLGISYGQELLWKANTTGTNYEESAVVYIDGIAYIGSCSTHGEGHDKLFAVNTSTGDILWSKLTGPGYVGPVIDNDILYFGTDSHGLYPGNEYIYAINRFTGSEIWNRKIYRGIPESIQYDEDKIYFCSDTVYALNKVDGSINWTYNMDSLSVTKPMRIDNTLYVASSGGRLYKLDTNDGSRIWSIGLSGGPWDNSITTDNQGRIFLGIYYDKSINAYNEKDGSLIWSYKLRQGSLSFNAYHNGVIYISDTSGYVYALKSVDGTLLWETKIGNKIDISSPTLSNGLLFIGTRDYAEGAFYVLNETTGEILWKFPVVASVTAPPSIADGMMFCGTDGWFMYCFDFGIGSDSWILHRYDSFNTAYSPNGLTAWQFVKAYCEAIDDVTKCTVINYYDHDVVNIILSLNEDSGVNWFDCHGNLLQSNCNTFSIDCLPSYSSVTYIISNKPSFDNGAPSKPHISGPVKGKTNESYEYEITTTDLDNNKIHYYIDWGDNSSSQWFGPFVSGEKVVIDHIFANNGTYTIKVKARDIFYAESDWAILEVSIPKIQVFNIFERLLYRFSILHWLIR